MKKLLISCFLLVSASTVVNAQQIIYSDHNKKDARDMLFEIIGKFDGNVLVYKNISRKHSITKYDADMKIKETFALDFVPDRTINVDFVSYPEYFFMIYQHQKNGIVYCDAVKIGKDGKALTAPSTLDTTKIGFFADNKIYTTTNSEDKQKILIYKRHIKNDNITIGTRLFDASLQLLDSTRRYLRFDDRREVYSEISVANDGTFVFARETRKSSWDNSSGLEVQVRKQGTDSIQIIDLPLYKKYVEDVAIKIDNLNRRFIINSFYFGKRRGSVEGLFSSLIDMNGVNPKKLAFNVFADSLRSKINSNDQYRFVFDNLITRNVVVKKNGGFVITAEDFYTETMNANNAWNRSYFNSMSPYTNDYYLYSPYYYGYRPWNNFGQSTMRFYYDDVVVASLDSSLKLQWNNIIHKKQYDIDNDNFLSYSIMNAGGELHFLFIEKDNQKQIISNHSVSADGSLKRYPTLKSNEKGYSFMPRLAKQVGARQMIVPFIYLSKIGFAKIDF